MPTIIVGINFYNNRAEQKYHFINEKLRAKTLSQNYFMPEVINIKSNNIQQGNTVLSEIKYLRGMRDYLIDPRNSNRYRVMVKEPLGYTAYCFSTPIYNVRTRRLVDTRFEREKSGYFYHGSNGTISVCQNRCVFETESGKATVLLSENPCISEDYSQSTITMVPTLNGIRFIVKGNELNLRLESHIKQEGIRFHSTCFTIMKEAFIPFLSVAALYACNDEESCASLEMTYRELEAQTYEVSLVSDIENATLLFEINLYEPKLFQDTTVESRCPDANNAYGAVGFIGKTKRFGEQWLYSRPDFSKIPDLTSKIIEKALLHIPILNGNRESLAVFIPEKRFCSFGSTWNKKVNAYTKTGTVNHQGKYLTVDATCAFTNPIDQTLVYNEGLILKKPKGTNNFIAISTGDCYSAPQILEIKFRN